MKLFISILVSLITFTANVNAQATVEQKSFLAQIFPKDMPDHVLKNTEIVPVTKKYVKKHNEVYLHDDLKGKVYQGYVREGDTLLVFNGQPYFSAGQNLFMTPVVEQKVAKQKKMPKTAEQRQQTNQVVGQVVNTVLNVGLNVLGQTTGVGVGNNSGYFQSSNPTILRNRRY